jgi:hypothetical protein
MGVGGHRHTLATLRPGRPATHCIGGWVGHMAGLDGGENLASTGIRCPDRPARSESLYRLSCHGPCLDPNNANLCFYVIFAVI